MRTCAEILQDLNALGAAFFFSISGRDDHTRFFTSLAYQLSTSLPENYRVLLDKKITRDKSLVVKTMESQFKKLIVEPLSELERLGHSFPHKAVLIDGLDECKSKRAQCEIIEIIAASVRNHTTPFRWAFFSRPEPHIEATFAKADVDSICSFSFLPISGEADAEIELYLTGAFDNLIRSHNLPVSRPWPSAAQVAMIVEAADGLFVYAATLLRFVSQFVLDPNEKLHEILDLIARSSRNMKVGPHTGSAFNELDIFYKHILGRIPKQALESVQLFLAILLLSPFDNAWEAILLCNLLRFSKLKFWSVCNSLHAVLDRYKSPEPSCRPRRHVSGHYVDENLERWSEANSNENVCLYHKSFYDFLDDPARSGDFCVSTKETREKLFNHLLQLHHDFSKTYLVRGADLILAPTIPNSAVSLSWSSWGEEYDSFIKLWVYDSATSKLIYPHALPKMPRALIQQLAGVDYHKFLLAQMNLILEDRPTFVEILRCSGISRRVDRTLFYCIPPSEFPKFDSNSFYQMIELYTELGIIQPHPSLPPSFSAEDPPRKGLYVFGRYDKQYFWYWEINAQHQCCYEFETVDASAAWNWYRGREFANLSFFLAPE